MKDPASTRLDPAAWPADPRLLDHSDVSTSMIYTHVLNKGGRGVMSPLDAGERKGGRAEGRESVRV